MLSQGQTVFAVVEQLNVKPEAVRERRRNWLKNEADGLLGMSESFGDVRRGHQPDTLRNEFKSKGYV